MPREQIAMTPEEILGLLAAHRWVVLATLDPDGSPWADLAACTVDGDELCFRVGRGTRSHANVERDPRVCCSIDVFPSYYEIRGASVHGRARRLDDPRLVARLKDPGVPVADPAGIDSALYAVPLGDVFSFDFGRIRSRY